MCRTMTVVESSNNKPREEIQFDPITRDADRARRFEALRAELEGQPKRRINIKLIFDKTEKTLIAFSLSAWPFMFTLLFAEWLWRQLGW